MCPIVVVQMVLIRYLHQWSMDPCGKPIWVARGTHLGHYGQHVKVIWASMRENLYSGGCEQQRCRPACTSA